MYFDVYRDLVYEFYNSLLVFMDEHGNIIGYTMSVRMRGEDYETMPEKYIKQLNYDNEGILNTLMSRTPDFLWLDLYRVRPYYANLTKLIGFSHPIVRILHQMIIYSLMEGKWTQLTG